MLMNGGVDTGVFTRELPYNAELREERAEILQEQASFPGGHIHGTKAFLRGLE